MVVSLGLPKYAPHAPLYVGAIITVLLTLVAVANVFHIPASVVTIIQDLIAALQPYAAPSAPPAAAPVAGESGDSKDTAPAGATTGDAAAVVAINNSKKALAKNKLYGLAA